MIPIVRISVVTPSFNQGQYIGANLESVVDALPGWVAKDNWLVCQNTWIEHLVVDGQSTDSTESVVRQFPHVRWLSEPDRGQSDALNKGFKLARGEWILWLNADDYFLPGVIADYIRKIRRSDSFDVAYGHSRLIDREGVYIKTNYSVPFWSPFIFSLCFLPPTSGSLFRANFLRENLLDIEFHYTMDREWFLRCASRLRALLMPVETIAFRVTEESKTGKYTLYGTIPEKHKEEQAINFVRYVEPKLPFSSRRLKHIWFRLWQMPLRQMVRGLKLMQYFAGRHLRSPKKSTA